MRFTSYIYSLFLSFCADTDPNVNRPPGAINFHVTIHCAVALFRLNDKIERDSISYICTICIFVAFEAVPMNDSLHHMIVDFPTYANNKNTVGKQLLRSSSTNHHHQYHCRRRRRQHRRRRCLRCRQSTQTSTCDRISLSALVIVWIDEWLTAHRLYVIFMMIKWRSNELNYWLASPRSLCTRTEFI